ATDRRKCTRATLVPDHAVPRGRNAVHEVFAHRTCEWRLHPISKQVPCELPCSGRSTVKLLVVLNGVRLHCSGALPLLVGPPILAVRGDSSRTRESAVIKYIGSKRKLIPVIVE